ncbi:hypothetical protein M426DRAFT_205279 [Hypoxylon sp. CI-4A]|nr:hypothetical protein M426DRAFT_205279 [Hypoxylon sp. CI-4A]
MGDINGDGVNYGKRLPLQIIKERAALEPEREWVSIPRTADPKDGWQKITWSQFAKAINRIADKIIDFAGVPNPGEFPTIAYIGTNDSRYIPFLFGAVKAGYKALFISPRNATEGQIRLFQTSDCYFIAHTPEYQEHVDLWKKQHSLKSFLVAPEREWYSGEGSSHIEYSRNPEEGIWDPLVVLHTSGSSGFPKPIVSKQGWVMVMDKYHAIPPSKNGSPMWIAEVDRRGKGHIIPMPFFHASGVYFSVMFSIHAGTPCIFPIGTKPLTADTAADYIKYSESNSIFLPPSVLQDMSKIPAHVEALKSLDIVMFGGGNLVAPVGDYLTQEGVNLFNIIAATELPYPVVHQPNKELWHYFVFDSEAGGLEFRPTHEDNTYQMFVKRKDRDPGFQGVFYTFPELDEYDTKDLFRPHPTLKNTWEYAGRADTVIVFSNGEKLNPLSIETIVTSHPEVKGALVVGQDRFQPALFIEPIHHPQSEQEEKELISRIWPLVVQANNETVAHGRIEHDFIALTKPEKPFLRAGKGTIQRGNTNKFLEEEIDALYERAENSLQANAPTLDISSENGLLESLQKVFTERLETPKLGPDTDFFSAGIDSLQVIRASRLISAGLRAAGIEFDTNAFAPRTVYAHPTYKALAAYVFSLIQSGGVEVDEAQQAVQTMQTLVQKYTTNLPAPNTSKPPPLDEDQTVIVTGTTGALGSYLLHFLISDSNVKKIICLNRSKDGLARETQVFEERGLNADFSKAEFLQADLSLPDLGLGDAKYTELLGTVDRIIHNGWPVNFNIALSSFEPHIRGVRHFVDFSAQAARRVPVVFISSIGTVDHWDGPVPERQITDWRATSQNYGRSKMVSGLILDEAAEVSGVPTASIRVGQIAGSRYEKGLWNRQEWFPSIVASSVHLGALPGNLGAFNTIDWMAIEDVAHLVLDVSGVEEKLPVDQISGYFHSVNPQTTTWQAMVPAVQAFYGDRIQKIVDFKEWIGLLKASQETTEDVSKNPGIKLIDSYEGFFFGGEKAHVVFAMDRTKEYSKTARSLEAITPEMLQHWCKQWNY